MNTRDPDLFITLVGLVGVCILAIPLIVRLVGRRIRSASEAAPSQRSTTPAPAPDDVPSCKCGAPATRPAPEVIPRVSWVDSIRRALGMPPRYTLTIPSFAALVYCDVHGRVADTLTDEKLATVVLCQRKAAESAIVREVAAFITSAKSGLDARVLEAMTDDQRADHKARTRPVKAADVVPINRAANE